jgi:hypothetical protein
MSQLPVATAAAQQRFPSNGWPVGKGDRTAPDERLYGTDPHVEAFLPPRSSHRPAAERILRFNHPRESQILNLITGRE